jgi:hypothetical protein
LTDALTVIDVQADDHSGVVPMRGAAGRRVIASK